MELVHDFTVPVPADRAWEVLTDVERIAPCMPGASVDSVSGDEFAGGVSIKLGPIGMRFKGQGSFVEKDADAHRAVISAKGKDAKGNGGAQAIVTASLSESGGSTTVHVVTDLDVSGKAATFGSGVMKDVSHRLLAQFADNLAAQLRADGTATPDAGAPAPASNSGAEASSNGTAPSAPSASRPAAAPAESADLDMAGLLLGSPVISGALKLGGIAMFSAAFGYLLGKNRMMERQLRHG